LSLTNSAETFPELSSALQSQDDCWQQLALAGIVAAVTKAHVVYQAIQGWASKSKPCPKIDHEDCLRRNDVHLYAGETMVAQTAKRVVPNFEGTQQAREAYDEDKGSICQKNYVGKAPRSRCMLIVHICLEHGAICHFHLTASEGRKDMMLPIYRSWSTMPELIVYDYACG